MTASENTTTTCFFFQVDDNFCFSFLLNASSIIVTTCLFSKMPQRERGSDDTLCLWHQYSATKLAHLVSLLLCVPLPEPRNDHDIIRCAHIYLLMVSTRLGNCGPRTSPYYAHTTLGVDPQLRALKSMFLSSTHTQWLAALAEAR